MRRGWYYFVVFLIYFGTLCWACTTNRDCSSCHVCHIPTGQCVAVESMSDPFSDCGVRCQVKLVCSQGYCVFPHPPSCDCDFQTGMCPDVAVRPAPIETGIVVSHRPSLPPDSEIFVFADFVEAYEIDIHIFLFVLIIFLFLCVTLMGCHVRNELQKLKAK